MFGPFPAPRGWTGRAVEESVDEPKANGLTTVCWDNKQITIKEGSGGVVGTGAVISGSAGTFLEFLSSGLLSGNILELGSGTGVVAIGAATHGCFVVATDVSTNPHGCPPAALRAAALDDRSDTAKHFSGSFSDLLCVIEHNARLNQIPIKESGGELVVAPLSWGDSWQLDNILQQCYQGFDFIIGCNVTYQTSSYPDLMGVIRNASCSHTRTFLATTDCLGDNKELSRVAKVYGMLAQEVLHCRATSTIIMEISLCK